MLYNAQKIPTSTIQILVFCVVAFGLGFLFTRLLDLLVPPTLARAQTERQTSEPLTGQKTDWAAHAFPGVAPQRSRGENRLRLAL